MFYMHISLCTMYIPGTYGGHKWASAFQGLELLTIVSRHVCAGKEPKASGRAASNRLPHLSSLCLLLCVMNDSMWNVADAYHLYSP